MSAAGRYFVSGLMSLLVVMTGWERPVLSQPLFHKVADLPAIVSNVQGSLVEGSNQTLYGTSATGGGSCNCGTIFKVDSTGVVSILHAFRSVDGASPNAPLVRDAAGDFWGTARYGGAFAGGVIFKITPDGRYTVIHSLNNGANARDGVNPYAGLVKASDGNFYGVTGVGGAFGHGTIFTVRTNGTFTVLHAINDSRGEGRYPLGTLVEASNGRLFGTTSSGGPFQNATIFSFDRSTGTMTVEHAFAGWNGATYPEGRNVRTRLVKGSDGKLWGSTVQGGRSDGGTIFSHDPVTRTFTSVYHLAPHNGRRYPDGFYPGGLIEASDGNLWGVASGGGLFNGGTVFRVSMGGTFTVVHDFNNNLGEGVSPAGELTQMTDGRIYGVTRLGGLSGYGSTLFAIYP